MVNGLIFFGLVIIILFYLKDKRDLIIPNKKKSREMVLLAIGIVLIVGMTYVYAQTWSHYIVGSLGVILIILEVFRGGMTSKGIIVLAELNIFGYWRKIQNVEVSLKEDVKVEIDRGTFYRKEIHYYEKQDYDRVIALLLEHLPNEKIKIN